MGNVSETGETESGRLGVEESEVEKEKRILTISTQTRATMLLEVQAITVRTLELTRDIHVRGSNGRSTRH